MFKKVKSQLEQERFATTWEYFCERNDWNKDPYEQRGERYQLLLSKKEATIIGTIEFVPYHFEAHIERYCRFSKLPLIHRYQHRVWVIDKLCLHKDYHRKGYFSRFFDIIYHHAKHHQPKYYIAIVEKRLYRLVKMFIGKRIVRVDKKEVRKQASLIPVVIEIEQIMKNYQLLHTLIPHRKKSLLLNYFFTQLGMRKNRNE